MTVSRTNGIVNVTDVINTGNAFCGVKDISHALLAKLPARILQLVAEEAAETGKLHSVNELLVSRVPESHIQH